ncbi:PAS domain-containing protein [Hymenobacter taeanensis]|uniref:histidine kinase n=1 Tax=Hymenobacter taeanensis TaxID=2735321 RepID=A0A6M6BDN7_9BACT|nr:MULTISPECIES: PAS domain-containing protein [Hymenobacter]QJX46337.1 PAS domain-containing protein [Hymenobacter taeanensis]UOQ80198.1 PAS domain-containing protein [Hymenobacter sp. 5414T-23]
MLWSDTIETVAGRQLMRELQPVPMLDALPHLAWLATPDGTVIHCNARWFSYTGAPEYVLADGGFIEYLHPDDRADAADAQLRHLPSGQSLELHLRWLGQDGRYRWYLDRVVPLYSGTGEMLGWLGTSTDIDEQKRTEMQERRGRELFELMARATNDLIWDWDINSGRMWYSEEFWQLVGHPPRPNTETIAFWLSLIHPDDLDRVTSGVQSDLTTTSKLLESQYRLRRADGRYLTIQDRACVIHDATGLPVRMVGAMRDVSSEVTAVSYR